MIPGPHQELPKPGFRCWSRIRIPCFHCKGHWHGTAKKKKEINYQNHLWGWAWDCAFLPSAQVILTLVFEYQWAGWALRSLQLRESTLGVWSLPLPPIGPALPTTPWPSLGLSWTCLSPGSGQVHIGKSEPKTGQSGCLSDLEVGDRWAPG